jgi:subtilisin family serine protease
MFVSRISRLLAALATPALVLLLLVPNIVAAASAVSVAPRGVYNEVRGETGPAVYIVQFTDPPLAIYDGRIPGLAATAPRVLGSRKLDLGSPASRAYESYLADRQSSLLGTMSSLLNRALDVRFVYRHAYNGVAVVLSPSEAARVVALDGVQLLYRESEDELLTDAGPTFIGTTRIWDGNDLERNFSSPLDGSQEVPPAASAARGEAEISFDLANSLLSWAISHNVAGPTAAHIHSGAAGVNGPVEVVLDHTANPIIGSAVLTAGQRNALMNANLYINIHTAAFPGGEIRGQILAKGKRGEGIIVGIIDTGINSTHPAFAAVSGDGYVHANPYGSGNFVGYCVANPSFCNDKLIGAWALHPSSTNPEDSNGHGSHTAGTAAGNWLPDPVLMAPTASYPFTAASGVAQRANIIAYQVCVPSCPTASTTAAVNQAVIDGVDVLNYSISGGSNPYVETTAVAFRNAAAAGVMSVSSAGNSGPGAATVGHQAPWLMTVAASTHDRAILNRVTDLESDGGTLPDIIGESATASYGPAALVYAGDFGNPLCNPFGGSPFSGEIVVCDRGVIGRVNKGENVLAAGAGGMILLNDEPNAASLNADAHVLPATHISYADGLTLKAWMAANPNPVGQISGGTLDHDNRYGDNMASFSSRGPAGSSVPGLANLIKPDVSAPGLNILAPYYAGFTPPPSYNINSGTSMSSPHAAGAAALLRSMYPAWTPAQVKSALMMSGLMVLDKEDGTTPGDPFDFGAGRIDLTTAGRVGFVLDVTNAEYLEANPGTGGDPRLLNLASMASVDCPGVCSWTRSLQNVLDHEQEYDAWISSNAGIVGTVTPSHFIIPASGSQEITVMIDVTGAALGAWSFAELHIQAPPDPSAPVANDFEGAFAIPAWTLVNDPEDIDGSFNTNAGPPVELFLTGADNSFQGSTDFRITIPTHGRISFDWGYQSADVGQWDSGGIVVNGDYTVLAYNDSQVPFFDASHSLLVLPGDTFAFRAYTSDGQFGPGTLAVGNFRFEPLSAVAKATMPIAAFGTLPQPAIGLAPSSLDSTQLTDTTGTRALTIGNTGMASLDWSMLETLGSWNDDFDAYATGQNMHGVGGWKGWDNNPAFTAFTSSAQARSAPNALAIEGDNDPVREYDFATGGQWIYRTWQYIPGDMTGTTYFILLNTYADSGTKNWSVQVQFNVAAGVSNDGVSGGNLPLITNQWVEIRVEVDLDADTQTFFYNNQVLYSGSWTGQVSGGGQGTIGALSLYANNASVIYYDDLELTPAIGVCDDPEDIAWLSATPENGTVAPMDQEFVTVEFDSTGLGLGEYNALLCVHSNDPSTPRIELPVLLRVVEDLIFDDRFEE